MWHQLLSGLEETQTLAMEQGWVTALPFIGGGRIGAIELRLCSCWPDAVTGILEISHFAVPRLTCDLIPVNLRPEPDIISASPGRHDLLRTHDKELLPGRTPDGLLPGPETMAPNLLGPGWTT